MIEKARDVPVSTGRRTKTREQRVALVLCAFLLGAWSLAARKAPQNDGQSCLHFAQGFYNFYLRAVRRPSPKGEGFGTWLATLKYDGQNPLSPELAKALIDSDAESKIDGDPVLDFDPILDTQDRADRYVVRNVIYKNGHYWAEVYGVWPRPVPDHGKEPNVVAELTFENDRWSIVNFHYPDSTNSDNENLLGILRYQYDHNLLELTTTDVFALSSWRSDSVSVLGFALGMNRAAVFDVASRSGLRLSGSTPPSEEPCRSDRCDVETRSGLYLGVSLEFDARQAAVSRIDVSFTPEDAAPQVRQAAVTKSFKGNTYEFFNHYSDKLRSDLLGPGVLVKRDITLPPKVYEMDEVYDYPERGLRIYTSIDETSPQAPVAFDLTVSFTWPQGKTPYN